MSNSDQLSVQLRFGNPQASPYPPRGSAARVAEEFATHGTIIYRYRFDSASFEVITPSVDEMLAGESRAMDLRHFVFLGEPNPKGEVRQTQWELPSGRLIRTEHVSQPWLRDGALIGLYGTVRDLTGDTPHHLISPDEPQTWQAVLESAPDALFVKDRDFRYVFLNRAAESLLNMPRSTVLGKTAGEIFASPTASVTFDSDYETIHTGRITVVEVPYVDPDGVDRVRLVTKSPLHLADGTVHGLVNIVRDITRQKRVQQALADSEAFVRAILDSLSAEIAILRDDGRILATNQSWGTAMEAIYPAPFGVGDSYFDFLDRISSCDPESAERVREVAVSVSRGVLTTGNVEICAQCGPLTRWLAIRLTRLSGDDTGRIVAVHEDITDRKSADEALRASRTLAESANRAKSDFLSRMSHELRTPLNAILGFAQILEASEIDAASKQDAAHIVKAGRHLLKLINEVLDISRIEAGRLAVSLEPVAIREAVTESVDLLRPIAAERSVQVSIIESDKLDNYALADKQRLKQVLINLIGNAIKYNTRGGTVVVSAGLPGDGQVSISISDTGFGISADKLSRVFDPFERLNADQTTQEGSGLGLTVAKRLTEAMRGSLDVSSTLRVGTTFTVNLPQTTPEAVSQRVDLTSSYLGNAAPKGEGRILCIEDNEGSRLLIKRALELHFDCTCEEAQSGGDGLTAASRLLPHLILLDVDLPDVSGREVLHELKMSVSTQHIPVVVVTADVVRSDTRDLLSDGAAAVLSKPIDMQELTNAVSSILRIRNEGNKVESH